MNERPILKALKAAPITQNQKIIGEIAQNAKSCSKLIREVAKKLPSNLWKTQCQLSHKATLAALIILGTLDLSVCTFMFILHEKCICSQKKEMNFSFIQHNQQLQSSIIWSMILKQVLIRPTLDHLKKPYILHSLPIPLFYVNTLSNFISIRKMCDDFLFPQKMFSRLQDPWERPFLTYLEKNRRGGSNGKSRKENDIEEILAVQDITKHDGRLKAFFDRIKERRNAVCEVLISKDYFATVPRLVLHAIHKLKLSGLI